MVLMVRVRLYLVIIFRWLHWVCLFSGLVGLVLTPVQQQQGGPDLGYIAVTTNLAAAGGAVAAMIASWIRFGKPDVSMSLNGVLAGLVAITAGCDCVTFGGGNNYRSDLLGVLVVVAVEFIDKVLKIDDPVGAVSVHGVCGVWGTIGLSFFHVESSFSELIGTTGSWCGCNVCMGIWYRFDSFSMLLKQQWVCVQNREEELRGLDIEEHGNEAYPGFQIFTNM